MYLDELKGKRGGRIIKHNKASIQENEDKRRSTVVDDDNGLK